MSCMQGLMGEMKEARKQLVHQVLSVYIVLEIIIFRDHSMFSAFMQAELGVTSYFVTKLRNISFKVTK